jgi:hypothetical protein
MDWDILSGSKLSAEGIGPTAGPGRYHYYDASGAALDLLQHI